MGRTQRDWLGVVGEVQIVGAAGIAEGVHKHDAMKAGAIFGSGFYFRLILLIDLRPNQRRRLFELLYARFEAGAGFGRVHAKAPRISTMPISGKYHSTCPR